MNSERLKQLFDFLKDDPNDSFTLYAIATEYNTEDHGNARKYFEILLKDHPKYLPTYYHVANLYADLGEHQLAEATYKKGIDLALEQSNSLAHRELQNAYNEFLFED